MRFWFRGHKPSAQREVTDLAARVALASAEWDRYAGGKYELGRLAAEGAILLRRVSPDHLDQYVCRQSDDDLEAAKQRLHDDLTEIAEELAENPKKIRLSWRELRVLRRAAKKSGLTVSAEIRAAIRDRAANRLKPAAVSGFHLQRETEILGRRISCEDADIAAKAIERMRTLK